MSKTRCLIFAGAAIIALGFSACSSDSDPVEEATATTEEFTEPTTQIPEDANPLEEEVCQFQKIDVDALVLPEGFEPQLKPHINPASPPQGDCEAHFSPPTGIDSIGLITGDLFPLEGDLKTVGDFEYEGSATIWGAQHTELDPDLHITTTGVQEEDFIAFLESFKLK